MTLLSELKKIDQMHDSGEISQEEHDRLSAQAVKKYQPKIDAKIKKIAVAALIIALIGWVIPTTTTTSTNQTIGLNIIVNNTNLAPTFAGESNGTGQRVTGVTYFNNNSDIELFVISHGSSVSNTSEIHLFINGTKVADTSGKPLAIAEQNNRSITVIIPRYSAYKVEFNNYHHYEWREYQILSGNFTSNIADNDTAYVNKSGDTMTGTLNMNGNDITSMSALASNESMYVLSGDSVVTTSLIFPYYPKGRIILGSIYDNGSVAPYINISREEIRITNSDLNMSGNNITNCGNCITNLSRLVNETIVSSNTRLINFTVPNNPEGFEVHIYLKNNNASTATISLYINNDFTDANYTSQVLTINGASVASSRSNANIVMVASANIEGYSKVNVQKTNLNTLAIQSQGSRFINSTNIILEQETITKPTPISNITTMSLSGDLGNSIGTGSMIRIYKIV